MRDERIRVLFFIPALVPGGAERIATTLLRNISRDRFDLSLAVVSRQGSVFSEDMPPDVPVIDLQSPRLRYALPKIVRLMWKAKPDVVFSTIDYCNVALGATRPFWPRNTHFIARPAIMFSAAQVRHARPRLWRASHRLALLNTDVLVFQSSAMEQDYRDSLRWRNGSAAIIPNPLDFSFVQERMSSPDVDTAYRPDRFNLVAAGRLEEQKGFDIAIEALAWARNKNIHLTILGDGSLRRDLEEQAKRLDIHERVRFLGYRHNPYPYYAKADGFLLSSRFEGFPNVVIEALSCGTPVVATPVAGLNDILGDIEQCRLSEDFTAVALAKAIDRLVSQGSRRVSPQSVSRFDAQQVTARYEELFSLGGKRRVNSAPVKSNSQLP
jgi:glycosyltransferase involved in cell wall biosynthesis